MEKKRNKKQILMIITAAIIIGLTAAVVFCDFLYAENVSEHSGFAMGSEIKVQFYGKTDASVADKIFKEISRTETQLISKYKDTSEIFRLNESGTLAVSDETLQIIRDAMQFTTDSDGAFDILVGNISALWNFDSAENIIPDNNEIETALKDYNDGKITFDGNRVTLTGNVSLDTGAVGKGYACDKASDVLEDNGVESAVVSVGGTILIHGKTERSVGIRTPEKDDFSSFIKLDISGGKFISTSGQYEKSFEQDGKLYHHILDTKTGYPADSGLKSVTVISDSGLVSDALSTACFVLGKDDSASLLEKHNAEAIFVDNGNNVYVTKGIFNKCTLLNEAYKVLTYE